MELRILSHAVDSVKLLHARIQDQLRQEETGLDNNRSARNPSDTSDGYSRCLSK
jgi:hypothetical protein